MQPPVTQVAPMRRAHASVLIGWAVLLIAGLAAMAVRDLRPGALGPVPVCWPAASRLVRDRERLTLLLFAHPHCPCTVATLRELERILAHGSERVRAEVVFCVPDGAPADWERTDLWRQASSIPGLGVCADRGGHESRLFGAGTSGTALLYDERGGLRFQGGLTGARGHEGDNAGKSAVLGCLQAAPTCSVAVPVFGCPLFDDGQRP